jgi:hypothetical protein
MLFSDVAHRHLLAFAVGDGDTEDALAQENSLRMVPQSAMPEIREEGFGLINYVDKALDPPRDYGPNSSVIV